MNHGRKDSKKHSITAKHTLVDFRAGLDDADALYRLECGIKGISPGKTSLTPAPLPIGEGYAPPPVSDLPIGSYLPFPPNPLFEGRVNDLKTLAESLLSNSITAMIVNQKAITGMGGLGKTQLAVEFAYRYGSYFRGVHWLNLADSTLLDSEIAQCGTQMGLANWPDDQPFAPHGLASYGRFEFPKVFMIAGYLAPNAAIPPEIFEKSLEISTEICDENLARLYGLGLLRLTENSQPAIHPLLAEYARYLDNKQVLLKYVSDNIASICYIINNSGLPTKVTPFLPHLLSNIQIIQSDDLQEIKATLLTNLGFHQNAIADYQGATRSYKQAIDISEKVFGSEHELTALRVNNLGLVLKEQGDFNGARAMYERALEIKRKFFPPNHPSIKLTQENLDSLE